MFFQEWDKLLRTLSKISSFDVVVTVAFGSALASLIITNSLSLRQGLTAIALLIALQYVIMWLSVRLEVVNRLVKTSPILLLFDGELLQDAMQSIRVTEDEIRGALRQKGIGSRRVRPFKAPQIYVVASLYIRS